MRILVLGAGEDGTTRMPATVADSHHTWHILGPWQLTTVLTFEKWLNSS